MFCFFNFLSISDFLCRFAAILASKKSKNIYCGKTTVLIRWPARWVTALQVVRTSFLGLRPRLFPPPPPPPMLAALIFICMYPMVSAMTSYSSWTSRRIFVSRQHSTESDFEFHQRLKYSWRAVFSSSAKQCLTWTVNLKPFFMKKEQQTQERRIVNPRGGRFDIEKSSGARTPTWNSAVRVKGGMSLRNGMWHGLRNDIIMRNLIYAAEWSKEIN